MDFDAIWQTALGELSRQMTQATFDSWLSDSRCVSGEGGELVVEVKNRYAVDWLESRLLGTVQRTLARVAETDLAVRFVARNGTEQQRPAEVQVEEEREEEPEPPRFVVPEYDVHEAGWFPVSEYECRFWAPLLGRVGWRVWEIVRKADRRKVKTAWTPAQRWTAPALAEQVPCGRQALVGVMRQAEEGAEGASVDEAGRWWYHHAGAFDRLTDEGVAMVERRGVKRHTTYWISVQIRLGILRPGQVVQLPARLQVQHDRWLEAHGFDPQDWDTST